jgi:glycosyltransferase involved in cell wall biosynthesis
VVGTVGRLEPRKGTATLIAALAALRDAGRAFAAVVVGDGPLRAELERDIAARGLGAWVQMFGDRSEVRDVLAALDAFVLPSRTEGMSNALLEAMAMGLPAIATAVGGNPEVVTDGTTGLLVPADDPAAMAAALARMLDDASLASRLGAAARRVVEDRYGARSMVRRLEAVYGAVAAGDDGATAERTALVATPKLEGAEPR